MGSAAVASRLPALNRARRALSLSRWRCAGAPTRRSPARSPGATARGLLRTPVAKEGRRCDNRPVPVEGHLYGERVWFHDARGHVRRMGVSTHPADSTVVISLWQGDVCTGTFRMPAKDAARLISTLAYGMTEAIPGEPSHSERGSEPTWPALVEIPASCHGPNTGKDRGAPSAARVGRPGARSAFPALHRHVRKRAPLESSIRRNGRDTPTMEQGASPVIIARWRPQAPCRKSTNTRFWWTHCPSRHGRRCSTRSRGSRLGPGGVSWRRSWDADLTRRVAHLAPREPLSPAFASRGPWHPRNGGSREVIDFRVIHSPFALLLSEQSVASSEPNRRLHFRAPRDGRTAPS